jgi:hypothetical protein
LFGAPELIQFVIAFLSHVFKPLVPFGIIEYPLLPSSEATKEPLSTIAFISS